MKRKILGFIAGLLSLPLAVLSAPSANDLILTQVNAAGTASTEVDVLPTTGGILTFNGSLVPIPGTIAGTAGQVAVNYSTGTFTFSLPSALTGINSITSVAGQNLVLATGTGGTAITIGSSSTTVTFAVQPIAPSYQSTVSTGTAPLTVSSTTQVTHLNASLLTGYDWTAPPVIGATTPGAANFTTIGATTTGTGAFTTVSASGVITSTVSTGTAPFTVSSTTKVANLNVAALEGDTWESPGTIGSSSANTGAFTTLSASSTVSGSGFASYLASPPAIGSGAPAAGTFTSLTGGTTVVTGNLTVYGNSNDFITTAGASNYVTIQTQYQLGTNETAFLQLEGSSATGNTAAVLSMSNIYSGNGSSISLVEAAGDLLIYTGGTTPGSGNQTLLLDNSSNATFYGNIQTAATGMAAAKAWNLGGVRSSTGLVASTTTGLQVYVDGVLHTLAVLSTNP